MRNSSRLLLGLAASAAMLGGLVLCTPAKAETNSGVMIGIFCRSQQQMETVIAKMRHERDAEAAMAEVNKEEKVCVHPTAIGYIVVDYTQISVKDTATGKWYFYKGQHIGVMMGQIPMPLSEPVTQYFVSRRPLPNAIILSGA